MPEQVVRVDSNQLGVVRNSLQRLQDTYSLTVSIRRGPQVHIRGARQQAVHDCAAEITQLVKASRRTRGTGSKSKPRNATRQLCRFERAGHCREGSSCRFIHANAKDAVRHSIWLLMESRKLVNNAPLFTVDGNQIQQRRIPSFKDAAAACNHLVRLPDFCDAKVIKVHPSLSATRLRECVLVHQKLLLVPPLPENDFLYYVLDPTAVPHKLFKKVASRAGWQRHGKQVQLGNMPKIDLVVVLILRQSRQS